MWIWVGRWVKRSGGDSGSRTAADAVRRHWEEVALDVGLDPGKNVTMAESGAMLAVGISEELDMLFREEGGSWQYY